MQLNFTVDTEDLFDEDGSEYGGSSFEKLLTSGLRAEIVKMSKDKLAGDEFKKFSELASDTVVSEIKLRLQNFLNEDVALTEGWGKPTFIGSIEDLIKKRFDEILLQPVDGKGKTLKGCTTVDQTWIQWKIEKYLESKVESEIKDAERDIDRSVSLEVNKKLKELKDSKIKETIGSVFEQILEHKKQ